MTVLHRYSNVSYHNFRTCHCIIALPYLKRLELKYVIVLYRRHIGNKLPASAFKMIMNGKCRSVVITVAPNSIMTKRNTALLKRPNKMLKHALKKTLKWLFASCFVAEARC